VGSRTRTLLFILFAPLTVPAYVLFLAGTNLLGGAYYIVIEASLSRLIGRPISLTRGRMALFAIPVLIAAPVAAIALLLIALFCASARLLCWIGHWQADVKSPGVSMVFGAVWVLAALWTTITCLNAAVGLGLIGQGISPQDRDLYVEYRTRPRTLGEMPAEMQARRKALLAELSATRDDNGSDLSDLKSTLSNDESLFPLLPPSIGKRLANIPWLFTPKEFSDDGLDRSVLLFGPLLFVWMLLIRWPGTFSVLRRRSVRVVWFLVRSIGATWAILALIEWAPLTISENFLIANGESTSIFNILSPALWFGSDTLRWAWPEWILYNAALWMILAGGVVLLWWIAWRVSPFLGWPRYYVAFLASRLLQRKRIAFFSVGAVTLCVAMMIIVISVMGGFVDSIRDRANGLLGDLVLDGSLQGFPYYQEFIDDIRELKDERTGEPLVAQATPLIYTYGILQFIATKETKDVSVRGIRLNEYVRVNEFGEDLFYHNRFGSTNLDKPRGQPVFGLGASGLIELPAEMDRHYREVYLPSLSAEKRAEEEKQYRREKGDRFYPGPGVFMPSPSADRMSGFEGNPIPGMIIGRDVIMRRLPSGEYERDGPYACGEPCFLTVVALTREGDVSTEPPPKPPFRYIDDSRTGIHEIDSKTVYVGFDRLQELLSMGSLEREDGTRAGARCSQIQIKLNEAFARPQSALLETKKRIADAWKKFADEIPADGLEIQLLGRVRISTWEEMQSTYIAAIEKEKFLVLIMFGVISIVAVLLILCIFYMIVQEKTRDVGIIKSVGGSTEGIAAVFLTYGAAIGIVGAVMGSTLGIAFVSHINEIQDWLARINPSWRVWSPETYSFDQIPSDWKLNEVICISVMAILASVAGAAIPAIRAGRTWPVESLRYE